MANNISPFFPLLCYGSPVMFCPKRVRVKDWREEAEVHPLPSSSAHCGKITIFVQKIKFSIIPFLAGKFKFNVGIEFIKIEFLNKNCDFASVCSVERSSISVVELVVNRLKGLWELRESWHMTPGANWVVTTHLFDLLLKGLIELRT